MSNYTVHVLEGTGSTDIATYFCDDKPWYDVEQAKDQDVVVLKFVPKNGSPARVNRINAVPVGRVLAVVENETGEEQ